MSNMIRDTKEHDHSENGTWVIIRDGRTKLIFPDGCVYEDDEDGLDR